MPPRTLSAALAIVGLAGAAAGQVAIDRPRPAQPAWPGVGAVGRITPLDSAGKSLGAGTGFWIGRDEVATAWHVICHGKDATLTMADGSVHRITRVIGTDEQADVAVVRAEPAFKGLFLPLADRPPAFGAEVRVLGGPGINPTTVLRGTFLEQKEVGFYGQTVILMMKEGVAMGWSGGPIVDAQGRCIGVARLGGAAKCFAAPPAAVQALRAGEGTALSDWDHAPRTRYGRSEELLWQTHGERRLSADESFGLLRQAVELSPDFWPGWNRLVPIYQARGQKDEALDALKKEAAGSPFGGAWLSLARELRARGQTTEADAAEAKARQIDPQGLAWTEYTRRAVQTMREGRFKEAIDPLIDAVNAEPETLEFRLDYAQCLVHTGKAADALPQVQIVLGRDPDSHLAYLTRGLALSALRRHEEALEAFKRAVALSPRSGVYHRCVGQSYASMGRFSEAEQELTTVRGLDPQQAKELEGIIASLRAQGKR